LNDWRRDPETLISTLPRTIGRINEVPDRAMTWIFSPNLGPAKGMPPEKREGDALVNIQRADVWRVQYAISAADQSWLACWKGSD
jgi:hypothetical protein